MAFLEGSFDPDDPYEPIVVIKRAADTLPDHVKGNIFWASASHRPAGYYLQDQQTYEYNPVEFIDNYWHFLDDEDEQVTKITL